VLVVAPDGSAGPDRAVCLQCHLSDHRGIAGHERGCIDIGRVFAQLVNGHVSPLEKLNVPIDLRVPAIEPNTASAGREGPVIIGWQTPHDLRTAPRRGQRRFPSFMTSIVARTCRKICANVRKKLLEHTGDSASIQSMRTFARNDAKNWVQTLKRRQQ
jgi:hypothetical protein